MFVECVVVKDFVFEFMEYLFVFWVDYFVVGEFGVFVVVVCY